MANVDAPRGLWPIQPQGGTNARVNEYTIATGYGTNIFTGDLVKLVAAGGIEVAAAGNRALGVFAGVNYTDAEGNPVFKKYWPASTTATDIKAYVWDDPEQLFGIQQETSGSVAATELGTLGDHVAGTGSTTTGKSGHELSQTLGTGAASLRVRKIVNCPSNAYGEHADLVVQIYEHEFSGDDPSTPGV